MDEGEVEEVEEEEDAGVAAGHIFLEDMEFGVEFGAADGGRWRQ